MIFMYYLTNYCVIRDKIIKITYKIISLDNNRKTASMIERKPTRISFNNYNKPVQ